MAAKTVFSLCGPQRDSAPDVGGGDGDFAGGRAGERGRAGLMECSIQ
eukprot:SAG31_NODE_33403_length_344_cov_0.824490_1_plen_46_part_10